MEIVGEVGTLHEPPRDEQDPGLADEKARIARLRRLEGRQLDVVGPRAKELEVAERNAGEIERRLRIAALPQLVQPPDDAGGAYVEVLHRAGRVPPVPVVGAPHELGAAKGVVGIRDDLADRSTDTRLVPRSVRQTVKCLRPVERLRLLERDVLGAVPQYELA